MLRAPSKLMLSVIAAILLMGCAGSPSATVQIVEPTRTPPPIPTDLPLTPTPSITHTATVPPTATETVTATLTPTPTATGTATATPSPTATTPPTRTPTPFPSPTERPTQLPTEPPTDPPPPISEPAARYYELDSRYTGRFSGIGPNARAIFERGQAMGRDPHRFVRIGDSEYERANYLTPYDHGDYDLGQYGYLRRVIDHYAGSFDSVGPGVFIASGANTLMDPEWADPDVCRSGEHSVGCAIRVTNPSVALVLVRTWDPQGGAPGSPFEHELTALVEYIIDQGVLPVLATHLHHNGKWVPSEPINETIRQVANRYQVPLWDFYLTTEALPFRGNDTGNHYLIHPDGTATYFYGDYLLYAKTHHNLETLEVLHAMLTLVVAQ